MALNTLGARLAPKRLLLGLMNDTTVPTNNESNVFNSTNKSLVPLEKDVIICWINIAL